jgi:hypothetical protein
MTRGLRPIGESSNVPYRPLNTTAPEASSGPGPQTAPADPPPSPRTAAKAKQVVRDAQKRAYPVPIGGPDSPRHQFRTLRQSPENALLNDKQFDMKYGLEWRTSVRILGPQSGERNAGIQGVSEATRNSILENGGPDIGINPKGSMDRRRKALIAAAAAEAPRAEAAAQDPVLGAGASSALPDSPQRGAGDGPAKRPRLETELHNEPSMSDSFMAYPDPFRFSASSSKRKREDEPSGSGHEPADPHSAQQASRRRLQPSGRGLKRADSFPARLPSQPGERTEVKPKRWPITRPKPDTQPPKDFTTDGDVHAGSLKKTAAMTTGTGNFPYFEPMVRRDSEFAEIAFSRNPDFEGSSQEEKDRVWGELTSHPRFQAEFAKARNEEGAIPNGATRSRTMLPGEQKFLTAAFQQMKAHIDEHPFHMHGEMSIVGNREGEITWGRTYLEQAAAVIIMANDKYNLHSHPPFGGPLSSSASEQDHLGASILYRHMNTQTQCFVTNGRDVLHIQPDSTELVKLIPDPEEEKKWGEFPVAFRLPKPLPPPHPFSNHEAPGALKSGRLMPKRAQAE